MVKFRNPLWSIRKRAARLQSFPQVAEHDGALYVLDPKNWIDNRVLARVPYEVAQIAQVDDLIKKFGITDFIDIGANFGLYAITFGLLPQIERVVAFEPVRRNFNHLCANVFLNRLNDKVTVHRAGLGNARRDTLIHIDPRSTGVSRLDLTTTSRDTKVFSQSESIEIHRGDDMLPWQGRAILAKIDVEGAALEVLAGLERFLSTNHGALQVEVTGEEPGVDAFLAARGWKGQGVIGADRYFVRGA